jgi:CheY-like chemotaxis protein
MGSALVSVGHAFMLLKLNKVPKCPSVMELAGTAAYLDDSSGLALGLNFEKPRGDIATAIRNMVSNRSQPIPSSIPPKARRKAQSEDEDDGSLLPQPQERLKRVREPEPEASVEPLEKPSGPESPKVAEAEPAVVESSGDKSGVADSPKVVNPALVRLKKRSKTVLLYAHHAYGELLRDYLLEEGYGRVLVSTTGEEFIEGLHKPNLSLVLIDVELPVLEMIELVSQLNAAGLEMPPVILAAEDVSRGLVIAAHRAGVAQLLVKPYILDETFSDLLEQQMGIV